MTSGQDAVAHGLSEWVALSLIERLSRDEGERLRTDQADDWRWRGREVKLIDGTTVSMPNTSVNQAEFPQGTTQKAGLEFPLTRVVTIISFSCGAVLERATGHCEGKRTGQTAPLMYEWMEDGSAGQH